MTDGIPLLGAALLAVFAGAPLAVSLSRWPRAAGSAAALCAVAGAALGMGPIAAVLAGGPWLSWGAPWPMPGGALRVGLDPLSAFFLAPVLLIGAVAAVHGRDYLRGTAGKTLGLGYAALNLLISAMAVVVVARNAVLFLVAWEAMAVAAFFLVSWEHEDAGARRAGFVWLVAAHLGAFAILALFLVLGRAAGSYDFADFARLPPGGAAATAAALLAFLGFGAKAGLVPLHVWLPEAHAAAPAHVSALLSAALIKLGFYGLLRTFLLLGAPAAWWGPLLAVLGLVGALLGIALALSQRDLKRALAYSSVENVGVIALGLGLAYAALGRGEQAAASLALAGGLLHVWNHALMKGTMFLASGGVVHATHTRDLAMLGGLARRMPFTAAAMAIGAVALSALPPLNGFASEWLIYLGLIRRGLWASGAAAVMAMVGVGLLALVGALAALTFVRLIGIALLGNPRSAAAAAAHESGPWLLGPTLALAAGCVAVGLFPAAAVGALGGVAGQLLAATGSAAGPLAPDAASLPELRRVALGLWGAILVVAWIAARLRRGRPSAAAVTWDCGYAAPDARMQYGPLSFAELAASTLPRWVRPQVSAPPAQGLFPTGAPLTARYQDPLMRGVYEPAVWNQARWLSRFAWLQRGVLQSYILYVLIALLAGFAWINLRGWLP